jgi:hypothetical protein
MSVIINGIVFEKDPMKYFAKKKVETNLFRIAKVNNDWFLSLISILRIEPGCKAGVQVTTILLSEPPFTELENYFQTRNIIKFKNNWDNEYWQDLILSYRRFGIFEDVNIFDEFLDSRAEIKNALL